jgi:hypothetical protein
VCNVITEGKYRILKWLENLKRVLQNVLVILITGITMDECTFSAYIMHSFIAVQTTADDTGTSLKTKVIC